ncbi:hypothetical protein CLAIMM_07562 [Cladophialophora immunda]|nr:hypothetical protein CLAIMM_07562 [Cladophialophora immunda]
MAVPIAACPDFQGAASKVWSNGCKYSPGFPDNPDRCRPIKTENMMSLVRGKVSCGAPSTLVCYLVVATEDVLGSWEVDATVALVGPCLLSTFSPQ